MDSKRRAPVVAAILIAGISILSAQSPTRPAFEVASVKLSAALEQGYGLGVAPAGNRFTAHNVPARMLILWAYDLAAWQVSGGPAWLDSDRFEIDAKPEHPMSREDTMLMVQSLLAERFLLSMHRETKEMPRYSLKVDNGGPRLTPHNGELGFQQAVSCGRGHATFRNVRMPRFAWYLKTQTGRAVLDDTGLSGNYDFKLDWTPEDLAEKDPSGPNLTTAIREQLGLKLESQRGPVEFFVIDRAEKPSGN